MHEYEHKTTKKTTLANFTRSLIFQCTWPFHYFVYVCLFVQVAECRQLLRRKQAHLCCCDDMSVWPLVEVPARPIVDALSLFLSLNHFTMSLVVQPSIDKLCQISEIH